MGRSWSLACIAVGACGELGSRDLPSPPIVSFELRGDAVAGVEVTCDASASRDPDGTIVSFEFDFGAGQHPRRRNTPVASFVFAQAGSFIVTVTATDDHGHRASASRTIEIRGLRIGAPVNVSRNDHVSHFPRAAMTSDAVYVVWQYTSSVLELSHSVDGGSTFSEPRVVLAANPDFGDEQASIAALDGGIVHIAFTTFDLLYGGAEILYLSSQDGGMTFTPVKRLSEVYNQNDITPQVSLVGSSLAVVWTGRDDIAGTADIYIVRSNDGGQTFSPQQRLPATSSPHCPAVAHDGPDRVYAAWIELRGSTTSQETLVMSFARSLDGGDSFEPPFDVTPRTTRALCPQLTVAANGVVVLLWDQGDSLATQPALARSADGGLSFEQPRLLSDSIGVHTRLAIDPSGTWLVSWATGDYVGVEAAYSRDAGNTFTTQPLSHPVEEAFWPQPVSLAADQFGLFWGSGTLAATSEIFFARVDLLTD